MDAHTYPRRGPSLSQLVLALNEELKCVAYSPSFTLDAVSQLDRDTSTALAAIREWRNSFTPINRIPLDVLSLIPTHLSSQKDRFHATFVCRHWRRTFLHHGTLWSQVFFQKGEAYMKTVLERANGSALDVFIDKDIPTTSVAVHSPHVQQIKHLEFKLTHWEDILKFSEVDSGPLPLLRTLKINPGRGTEDDDIFPPSLPLLSNAINLEEFIFDSFQFQFLNHFVFPRLTTFRLWTLEVVGSGVSELFDFLKASPTLQTVDIKIIDAILSEDIPQQLVVVLPNVEIFSLVSGCTDAYDVAAHISCPCAKNTSLTSRIADVDMSPRQGRFPSYDSLNAIVHQFARSPVEEVTLNMNRIYHPCSLTFKSSDNSTIRLVFQVLYIDEDRDDAQMTSDEIACDVFTQGLGAIRAHPQLSHIKRLCIGYTATALNTNQVVSMTAYLVGLFGSMGPLDKVTIDGGDQGPYPGGFDNFTTFVKLRNVLPPIKELAILRSLMDVGVEKHMSAIVELAKSQHARGIPFERVTVRARGLPAVMVEELKQWVGTADCCEEDSAMDA